MFPLLPHSWALLQGVKGVKRVKWGFPDIWGEKCVTLTTHYWWIFMGGWNGGDEGTTGHCDDHIIAQQPMPQPTSIAFAFNANCRKLQPGITRSSAQLPFQRFWAFERLGEWVFDRSMLGCSAPDTMLAKHLLTFLCLIFHWLHLCNL